MRGCLRSFSIAAVGRISGLLGNPQHWGERLACSWYFSIRELVDGGLATRPSFLRTLLSLADF